MSYYRSRHIKRMVAAKLKPHKPGEIVISVYEELMLWLSDNSVIIKVMHEGAGANAISSASKTESIIDKIKKG